MLNVYFLGLCLCCRLSYQLQPLKLTGLWPFVSLHLSVTDPLPPLPCHPFFFNSLLSHHYTIHPFFPSSPPFSSCPSLLIYFCSTLRFPPLDVWWPCWHGPSHPAAAWSQRPEWGQTGQRGFNNNPWRRPPTPLSSSPAPSSAPVPRASAPVPPVPAPVAVAVTSAPLAFPAAQTAVTHSAPARRGQHSPQHKCEERAAWHSKQRYMFHLAEMNKEWRMGYCQWTFKGCLLGS